MSTRRLSATQIEQAKALHRQGRVAEAAAIYHAVLTREPRAFEPHYLLAYLNYQQGAGAEAHRLISRALELKPASAEALALLAGILLALDRPLEALAACDRILALQQSDVETMCNRAVVLTQLDRVDEAIAQYDRAIALRPDLTPARFNRGTLLARRARLDQALDDLDRVLAAAPGHIGALLNRGNVLIKLDRFADALASFERILTIEPRHVDALNNRGTVFRRQNREDEALASFEKALAVDPRHVDTLLNYGNLLLAMRCVDAAIDHYDRLLGFAEDNVDAHVGRANALIQRDRVEEARAGYERALALASDNVDALFGWGNLLVKLGRIPEARAAYERMSAASSGNAELLRQSAGCLVSIKLFEAAARDFRRAAELVPNNPAAWVGLANCLLEMCDWRELDPVQAKVAALVEEGRRVNPFLFVRLTDDPGRQLTCARAFARTEFVGIASPAVAPRTVRSDRIRVAYLSPDFRAHPVGMLMAELFERHDRTRFDFIAMSQRPDDGSETRRRIVKAFDRFYDVRFHTDEKIAELVKSLDVDILVDLAGYSEFGRLGALARRPAPIQVSYLGYPGSVGADFVDYIIADSVTVPPEHYSYFTEKVVQLPDSYQANDSTRTISSRLFTRGEFGLPEQGFVFCCFNAGYKILPPIFEIWMRLLRNVEDSVLWLSGGGERQTANIRQAAVEHGVDPDRIVFARKMRDVADHFARHRLADLFVDTLPYNAHATASDALWAGLPVITCKGNAFAGRVAASLLYAVGMPELVTDSPAAYEALALQLARDPSRLQSLRRKLEQNRRTCPLFDTDRFRRHLESAYTTMYDIWMRGEAPRSFAVEPIAPPAR